MTSLRRGARVRRVLALFALAASLVSARAGAYCRTTTAPVPPNYDARTKGCITEGLLLFWRGACVGYAINQDATSRISFDDAKSVIDQAFETWTSATCPDSGNRVGISVSDLGPVECDEVRYNQTSGNQNVIVFRQDDWPYNDANNTLGLTTVTFNADTGEIYDADMEINATGKNLSVGDPVPAKGYDLLSVVTHEAGHFLGLSHATSPSSTMFASYKPGTTTLRSLTTDDIGGVCEAYPDAAHRTVDPSVSPSGSTEATSCDPTPRHGFTTKCEEPESDGGGCAFAATSRDDIPGGPALLAAAGALVSAVRRTRRRASRHM